MLFSSPRTRRIAVINHKGGTGKTTTAVHVAAGLADAGHRVLLVDFDPQGNVGVWFGIEHERTVADLLLSRAEPRDVILPVRPNLDVVLSDQTLGSAQEALFHRTANDEVLRTRLAPISGYEFCIVDCAPSLNLLTRNALLYAEEVIIPISMEYLALVGVRQLVENILSVRRGKRHDIEISAVVPTFFSRQNKKSLEIVESLRGYFGAVVSDPIRLNVKLSEAPSHGLTVFEYAPSSNGARDYRKLVRRFEHA
ncbi:MAG: ParA family protein [Gemmatimonadetes bacterium]|nr:ParA family protein [Gemmatimonadota bacterium]